MDNGSSGFMKENNFDRCSCIVDLHTRKECGYFGINEDQCIKAGCCWENNNEKNIPSCYFSADEDECFIKEKFCEVDEYKRQDCGYYGINKKDCIYKHCCWAESNISNIPWCFYPKTKKIKKTTRTTSTTTKTKTKLKSKIPGNPIRTTLKSTTNKSSKGFSKPTNPINICAINDNNRDDCGYLGITKNECEAGGCCWEESSINGVPWCFNELGKKIRIKREPITVRFLKPEGWNTINLWAWDTNGKNLYGDIWPGKPIMDLNNGWVSYTFPKDIYNVNVLFNNGIDKTKDINNIERSACLKLYKNNIIHTVDCGLNLSICKIPSKSRVQCGLDGISKDQCLDLNCCYNESSSPPSCYYSSNAPINSDAGSCNIINPLQRTICGSIDINEKECIEKGCCYNELSGALSCFNHGPEVPSCIVDEFDRERCSDKIISQNECESKGCCYDFNSSECFKKGIKNIINDGDCVYKVTNLENFDSGMTAILDLQGKQCQKYDIDIQNLDFEAKFETNTRLHIHIQPTDIENYPHNTDMPNTAYPFEVENEPLHDLQYSYHLIDGQNFQLQVKRNDGSLIFDGISFIYERQYLEISRRIKSNSSIYGFGEVIAPYKRNSQETQHALFNTDNPTPVGQNLYGSHPFYVEIIDGKANGFFIKNSHGMEFTIKNNVMAIQIIGGNFDMYFFMGPTVEEVVKQYYKVIGAPALLPYWALGWHQCRYGYKNIWEVEKVVENYRKNNIPLDTMWIDIDFMDGYKDFTYDPKNFPVSEVRKFVDNLKKHHQYYINMIDPAIAVDFNYEPFLRGSKDDIFIKNRD
eukprot:jgi/Orpsp1_1/1191097/evm.model.d7180000083480.1